MHRKSARRLAQRMDDTRSRRRSAKWLIEAPYVVQASHALRVHNGWTVACHDLGEAPL